VRAILQQQNEFNEAVVRAANELDIRICDNDRDSTALAVEIAKVGYRLNRIENQLVALGERLGGIEQAVKPRSSVSNESDSIESS